MSALGLQTANPAGDRQPSVEVSQSCSVHAEEQVGGRLWGRTHPPQSPLRANKRRSFARSLPIGDLTGPTVV
jgi:hypothetical protein